MDSKVTVIPAQKMWDYNFIMKHYPSAIRTDSGVRQNPYWWWAGDQGQVSLYWYSYLSRWLPLKLFQIDTAPKLAEILFQASRYGTLELHLNKGQAGASYEALQSGKETSVNPAVYDAAMLVIIAGGERAFPSLKGFEPKIAKGEQTSQNLKAAIQIIRDATPDAGTYVNEADYFEPNWQQNFWGENYPRLLNIKQKYDPENVFTCHHCVGSENIEIN